MGQTHASGDYFHDAKEKESYSRLKTLWSEDDLVGLVERLKDMTLNFSLDRAKFAKLLQLSSANEALVARWFEDFSYDRASKVVDGLEFLSAAVLLSTKVGVFRKICLLFSLFDLDRTGCIRKDEFTIFLKATTAGLHRTVDGLPPPTTVAELGSVSAELFGTLSGQALSQQDLLTWMVEAHYSLHYLSVLSRLGNAVFAWGTNHRCQLGLNLQPRAQKVPAPVLGLEGVRIASVASNESHSLFLTEEGLIWTCGSGFCGILGHGDLQDSPQPRLLEVLAHTRVIDVAVGVRHSVAISDKGQVFTWGAADLGQLGHGSAEDRELHQWASDPKTGGTFAYVPKPTVVMSLFGQRICAKTASCCNFSTAVLTDQGRVYSWGNNTDGQCGQGQRCPAHKIIYVDPDMHRTAMNAILEPRLLETDATFRMLTCGSYHMLAIDMRGRVWTWGQGMWGKLGHGSQRSMYEPMLVETLRHQVCYDLAAGEAHSLGLCTLYRLTISGSSSDTPLSPFSLIGLPIGRVDRHSVEAQPFTPPNTSLRLNAFANGRLRRLRLPFFHDPDRPIVDPGQHPPAEVRDSVLLMDRGLWEGEWLKLTTSEFDFSVSMSPSGAKVPKRTGFRSQIMFMAAGKWEPTTDCAGNICVFEELLHDNTYSSTSSVEDLTRGILDLMQQCQQGKGVACICILPQGVAAFPVEVAPEQLPDGGHKPIPFGVIRYEHGIALKKHVVRLINTRIQQAPDGVPDEVRDWRESREDFTGRVYYENIATGEKRWAPPLIVPDTEASIVTIKEDTFTERLEAVLDLCPKGIVICQQSWRPDVELTTLPEEMLENLKTPIVMVTYEAGEELKGVVAMESQPLLTMETQPYGGVCAWGNGTSGQLGLAGIENQDFMTHAHNVLTNEDNSFASRPCYVAHVHEHQVTSIACGAAHSVAATQQGEVFTWGAAHGIGVPLNTPSSEVPMFVEQLEGLVKTTKAFAGYYHSFVVADMPFKSCL